MHIEPKGGALYFFSTQNQRGNPLPFPLISLLKMFKNGLKLADFNGGYHMENIQKLGTPLTKVVPETREVKFKEPD